MTTTSELDTSETLTEDTVAKESAANLKKMAMIYGVATVAALTLFGAAHTWAAASSWALASFTSIMAAFVTGMVLAGIFHEWGHYSGAALSGSTLKVTEQPVDYFFFLNFDVNKNSTRQALWMSWGGLAGSWLLVVSTALLVPLDSWASAVLLATVIGRAINASVFEVPIARRTKQSENFKQELADQLRSPGIVKAPGVIAGLVVFALAS